MYLESYINNNNCRYEADNFNDIHVEPPITDLENKIVKYKFDKIPETFMNNNQWISVVKDFGSIINDSDNINDV